MLHNLEPAPGNRNPRRSGYYRGTLFADKEIISIDQIVAAMGPREPPVARSWKEFNTGFVYMLEPGHSPIPEPLQLHKDYIDRVVSDGPVGGVLRFNDATAGVAGVGVGQPVNDAIFPARRQVGGINTGAAIRNLGEDPITVNCQLMQAGKVRKEAEIPLAVNGQTARFIDELFPDFDTSDFLGSVRCRAPAAVLFAGVALEMDFRNRTFTALPVVAVQ